MQGLPPVKRMCSPVRARAAGDLAKLIRAALQGKPRTPLPGGGSHGYTDKQLVGTIVANKSIQLDRLFQKPTEQSGAIFVRDA